MRRVLVAAVVRVELHRLHRVAVLIHLLLSPSILGRPRAWRALRPRRRRGRPALHEHRLSRHHRRTQRAHAASPAARGAVVVAVRRRRRGAGAAHDRVAGEELRAARRRDAARRHVAKGGGGAVVDALRGDAASEGLLAPLARAHEQPVDPGVEGLAIGRANSQLHWGADDDKRVLHLLVPLLARGTGVDRLDRRHVRQRQHHRRLLALTLGVRERPTRLVHLEVAGRPLRGHALLVLVPLEQPPLQPRRRPPRLAVWIVHFVLLIVRRARAVRAAQTLRRPGGAAPAAPPPERRAAHDLPPDPREHAFRPLLVLLSRCTARTPPHRLTADPPARVGVVVCVGGGALARAAAPAAAEGECPPHARPEGEGCGGSEGSQSGRISRPPPVRSAATWCAP
mmetsp:Transcript_16575/g.41784  ORF Transcript_16575/g.41784 Transcript_16575/m.41784 type:complete len:397 (-) Transcript_16575:10-1200(-)